MAVTKKHKLRFDLPEDEPATAKAPPATSGWVYRSESTPVAKRAMTQDNLLDIGAKAMAYQAAAMTHAVIFGARLLAIPMETAKRLAS